MSKKFKDVDELKGVFGPINLKTKTHPVFMDVWDENLKKRRSIKSVHLVQRLINREKSKQSKESLQWYKRAYRRLQRLVKSNPDTIYIYDHTLEGDPDNPGLYPHWIDVRLAFPDWKGKIIQRWICTLATYKLGQDNQKDTIKYGGEYSLLEPESPEDRFDEMFFDLPNGFENEQVVIDCFRKWMKYFLPELADKKIEYKSIEDY
jgi:hypothetical protein